MTFMWQIPISTQNTRYEVAHYFAASAQTDELVRALCGKKVNPGFSKAANMSTLLSLIHI